MPPPRRRSISLAAKRALDLFVSIAMLILLSPVLALVSLLILLTMGRPILFTQVRPGKDGLPFRMVKFRTMKEAHDNEGNPLPDADRLTRLGQKLRSFSLDELPELFNVVLGDMSLVGPRPLLMQYLDRYTPEQSRRHAMRPGITGPVTVAGRNLLSWEEKFKLDVQYVDSWTLALDMKILAATIKAVFGRKGISQPGHATAEEFRGSESARAPFEYFISSRGSNPEASRNGSSRWSTPPPGASTKWISVAREGPSETSLLKRETWEAKSF